MNINTNDMNTTNETSNNTKSKSTVALALAVVALFAISAAAVVPLTNAKVTYTPYTLQAGGSTFINPMMQVWATAFHQYTQNVVSLNYQAIGSSLGQAGILANTFNFGAGDAPTPVSSYTPVEATYGPYLQMPEALGGAAIFYNIPGVTVSLNFTGQVLGEIYTGVITTWNDPAIEAINPLCARAGPGCTLPANTIVPVHRSDGSGTTYMFTHFMNQTSSAWVTAWSNGVISTVGCPCYGTTINWPGFEIGEKGSANVAAYVNLNPNTIGYADSYYALSNSLKSAAILNLAGHYVLPTIAGFVAAAAADASLVQSNPVYTITNAPGATSYPISSYTYLYFWADQDKVTTQGIGFDLVQFLEWVVTYGQAYAQNLNYAPLPEQVVLIDAGIIQQVNYAGVPYMESSTTAVSCHFASVTVGQVDSCKVTVKGTSSPGPTGSVYFTSSSAGTFSSTVCNLAKGATQSTCVRTFVPGAVGGGSVTITAAYQGDFQHTASANTTAITVVQKQSKTYIFCTPNSESSGSSTMTCKAKVTGYHPTGSVSWADTLGPGTVTFSASSCTLSAGICSVTVTGVAVGHASITATYAGDANNVGSSKTHVVNITP